MTTTQTQSRRRRKPAHQEPLIIGIDTREQLPYSFESMRDPVLTFDPAVHTKRITLPTGDYTAIGYEEEITIDRKSKADAFGSFGRERIRFEAEMARMAEFQFAAVVIEAEWSEIFLSPPEHSTQMNPKSIFASSIAWAQRYGVHFYAVPGREFAEQLTYRLIERFVRDRRGA